MKFQPPPLLTKIFPALILFFFCLLAYSNALHHPFMMDDHPLIIENSDILSLKFLQLSNSQDGNVYFRPISHLFVAAPFYLFGLSPFGFHIFNVLLFYLACVSVHELVRHLFKDPRLALATSLLFATHPINGIVVNYKTAAAFSFMIFAMNYSLLLALPFYQLKQRSKILLSLLLFLLALLCHETAAILPFFLLLILTRIDGRSFSRAFVLSLAHFSVLIFYLLMRTQIASLQSTLLENTTFFNFTFSSYLASLTQLLLFYFQNLLLLKNIVLMWATPIIENQTGLWIGSFIALSLVLYFLALVRWRREAHGLGILWLILGTFPLALACISRPNLGMLIESHWMFYATIGYCLTVASLILKACQHRHKLAIALLVILIASYTAVARAYNRLWNDEKNYCQYIIRMSPEMDLPHFWLGLAQMKSNDYALAKESFKKSIKNNFSQEWSAYLNLGFIEQEEKNFDQAIFYYKEAWKQNPNSDEIHNNLGTLFIEKGDPIAAKINLLQAIRLNPQNISARKNLAKVYLGEKKSQEAMQLYRAILAIDPSDQYAKEQIQYLLQE
jgi:Tfp pilus assembly protein PilF